MADPTIRVEGLAKSYRLGESVNGYATLRDSVMRWFKSPSRRRAADEILALDGVSFEVQPGEVVGVVGRNGAGKSTLLKILARITEPSAGRAVVRGRLGALLEVGTGFHPELTGRENVYLSGAILGMRRAEIAGRFEEIIDFAELARFVDTPVKHYSSGMYMRLAFAVAAHLEPEVLLVDEVLAVGDASFQRKCLGKMSEVRGQGRTVLFVSHNLAAVSHLCPRTLVLDGGRLVSDGPTAEALAGYLQRVTTLASTDLRQRVDRQGDGKIRITGWRMCDDLGQPLSLAQCGGALNLHLDFEAREALPHEEVHISIGVHGPLGEPAFYLSTLVTGGPRTLPPAGSVVCRMTKLPVRPGRYPLRFIMTANGVLADFIEDAGALEVGEGDFFRSGRLPPLAAGPFLVEHQIEIHDGAGARLS